MEAVLLNNLTINLNRLRQLVILAAMFAISACATTTPQQQEQTKQALQSQSSNTLNALIHSEPSAQHAYDKSVGYFVGSISGGQFAIIGGGLGSGLLINKADNTHTYMKINRYDLGPGISAGSYKVIVFFYNEQAMREFSLGKRYHTIGAEASVGNMAAMSSTNAIDNADIFFIDGTGGAATVTMRSVKVSVNTELTDTGLAEVSIPNIKNNKTLDESAPRQWNRALPFFAQEVIDKGYDLPMPYGTGLTYAKVDQAMILQDLEVGINGNEKEVFDFVKFENAFAYSQSVQAKFDTWLFPFMNVFALLGNVEGNAEIDVHLDGNGMLDQLGANCQQIPKPLNCRFLEDKTIILPIDTKFQGTTYGLGTILAGGWNNWFVTIPVTVVYADMRGTETEGLALTVTPRIGRLFELANTGQIATYLGGNYLDADLTVNGSLTLPDGSFKIDYTIEQANTDNWNTVVGANWDINNQWSVMLEYNGFNGSRDAWISGLTFRF